MYMIRRLKEILGDALYLIIGALALLAMVNIAHADVTPAEAERHCRDYAINVGGELSIKPLEINGMTWTASWGETIPGDSIAVTFADTSMIFVDQSSTMADHILTILSYRRKGQEPIAARFDNGGEDEYMMIMPMTVSLATTAEPGCLMIWLSK